MPTYYTHDIIPKGQTFRDFVKKCSECFITSQKPFDNSGLIKAREKYNDFKKDPKRFHSAEEWRISNVIYEQIGAIKNAQRSYELMLESAERFEVPFELAPLKEFMVSQLKQTIESDCDTTHLSMLKKSLKDYDVWLAYTEKNLLADIEFYQRDCERQIQAIMHYSEMDSKIEQALMYYECN